MTNDGDKIKVGKVLVKIPRKSAKAGDITGGLPRVTENLSMWRQLNIPTQLRLSAKDCDN